MKVIYLSKEGYDALEKELQWDKIFLFSALREGAKNTMRGVQNLEIAFSWGLKRRFLWG